jgi:hypothetical protein
MSNAASLASNRLVKRKTITPVTVQSANLHSISVAISLTFSRNSEFWDGIDGPWSSFNLRYGTNKYRNVRVLPSTRTNKPWLIAKSGCLKSWENIRFHGGNLCDESRGYFYSRSDSTQFYTTDNKSAVPLGQYEIFQDYGMSNITATVLTDSARVGTGINGDVDLEKTTIEGIYDYNLTWLGLLGLDWHPTNFTLSAAVMNENFSTSVVNREDPLKNVIQPPSLLEQLKNEEKIPSLSWAYHAGSYGCKLKKKNLSLLYLLID